MAKLNASSCKSASDVKGGYDPIENGMYHVWITDAGEKSGITADEISFQIITGTVDGQEGKVLKETFWRDKADEDEFGEGHLRLALATYMINGGEDRDISFGDYYRACKNRQCIIKVGKRPDKNDKSKHYDCIADRGMAIWGVNDPEVAHVPKHQGYLQQGGYIQQQAAPVAAQPVGQAPSTTAAPAPAPAPVSNGTPQYSV